jgi:hypothetical protein
MHAKVFFKFDLNVRRISILLFNNISKWHPDHIDDTFALVWWSCVRFIMAEKMVQIMLLCKVSIAWAVTQFDIFYFFSTFRHFLFFCQDLIRGDECSDIVMRTRRKLPSKNLCIIFLFVHKRKRIVAVCRNINQS